MAQVDGGRMYARTHEWVRKDDDGLVTVGISDHAQTLLGDVMYVDLPDENRALTRGEACCTVESVKAASEVFAPLTGRVVLRNSEITAQPELINQSPYDAGWLFRMEPAETAGWDALLSADDYKAMIEAGD